MASVPRAAKTITTGASSIDPMALKRPFFAGAIRAVSPIKAAFDVREIRPVLVEMG
jgi:hypothetical protein